MEIAIDSEIGPLRRVLVHRPSDEIERMTQHDLDLMLFDDILAPDETAIEHELMADVLSEAGAEVMLLAPLLRNAIGNAPQDARAHLVERICEHAGAHGVAPRLLDWDHDKLATGLIRGVYWEELDGIAASLPRLRADAKNHRFALPPVPNLMFMRDPCISVYDRVVMGRMATAARSREPSLVAFALRHAPEAGARLSFDDDDSHRGAPYRSLEGGDLLVISPHVVLIGCSLRTTAQTIQRLAEEALFPAHPKLQRVYAVMMPEARSVMHLDTLLTHVDRGLFLGHQPLLEGTDQGPGLSIARLSRDALPTMLEGATVLDVLREELGPQTQLIPCGGQDRLHQEREQWTDGANAVAMSPGHVILYARNRHTIRTMAEHGFTEVRLSVVHSVEERRQRIAEGMKHERAIFSFSGSELSRARGGGRCLTMPLQREPLT
ncbi:MAG: arginine deiminase family protein [Myxococcota bacterium]